MLPKQWKEEWLNAHGNRVRRTFVNADGSLSRYVFDRLHWEQYDTSQDAWYFGVWVNKRKRQTLTYAEGDLTLVECTDAIAFNLEIESMNRFYGEGFIAKTIDLDGTMTVYRQDRRGFFIPLLPGAGSA
jgi:hypothetical protein